MNLDLSRLFRPKSIAVLGGGWAANVVEQLLKSGYSGEIWPVNPKRADIRGVPCFPSLEALPGAPDASFVGVNREATVGVVRQLREMGGGGATLFASGFSESEDEGTGGADLQRALVEAAGDMPILGPNCYGFLNYLDNVTLWPDQHGGVRVERGVAIVSQSSNIAINMTMQARGLPIAYVAAAGNQAQTGAAGIASALMDDPRVTAVGFYLEGFGDIAALQALGAKSRALGKPVVVLKVGHSEGARAAAKTHTASLAGSAAAGSALLARFGMVEALSIETFLETLKLLHFFGPLPGNMMLSVSCSGGEASLMSDMALGTGITYKPFGEKQRQELKALLGPIVTIANPLDYHTFIWGDTQRMTDVFAAALGEGFDISAFVLDLPRADRCNPAGYRCAIDAIVAAKQRTGARVAVLASMPENITEAMAAQFAEAGIVTLNGMRAGLDAIDLAMSAHLRIEAAERSEPVLLAPDAPGETVTLDEVQSKAALAAHGLAVPKGVVAATAGDAMTAALAQLYFPLAVKALGIAHKTEAGAVAIGIADAAGLARAISDMPQDHGFLIEEMATGGIGELILGVSRDETGMFLLTIGAGGVAAEILRDTANLIVPATRGEIEDALKSLRCWPLFTGWRGRKAAAIGPVIEATMALQAYVASDPAVREIDINPLIVRESDAIAVDALIVTGKGGAT